MLDGLLQLELATRYLQILMTNSFMVHDACFGTLSFYKMYALLTAASSKSEIAEATTFCFVAANVAVSPRVKCIYYSHVGVVQLTLSG